MQAGFTAAYDADLTKYFDTIPHTLLIKALKARIADRQIIRLIRSWLKALVVEAGGRGRGGNEGKAPLSNIVKLLTDRSKDHMLNLEVKGMENVLGVEEARRLLGELISNVSQGRNR